MPSRIIPFVNEEYYHVLNRGVAQMQIFNNAIDYRRFVKTFLYYQMEGPKPRFSMFAPTTSLLNQDVKILSIVCFCLMPNHFHFLIRQKKEGGITEFVSKLSNSYTKYFNTKYKRVGPLLQGEFKAVHVETTEQLLHVSRYIHLNPLVGYVTKDLDHYQWSSYSEYVNLSDSIICEKKQILEHFKSVEEYKKFVSDYEDYTKKLEAIKHLALEVLE